MTNTENQSPEWECGAAAGASRVLRCNSCLKAAEVGTECACGNWVGESSHTNDSAIIEMRIRLLSGTV